MTGHWSVEKAPFAVVTDLGRIAGPTLGLATNGALDQYSAQVANILVANNVKDPLLEVTALGLRLRIHDAHLLIAVTGAELTFTVNGLRRAMWQPVMVGHGDVVEIASMTRGLRAYLSVHGSLDAPYLVGSCAPDTVIGFGLHLSKGDQFAVRTAIPMVANPYLGVSFFNFPTAPSTLDAIPTIYLTDGPDIEEFGTEAAALFGPKYTVSPVSNHIGLRLGGGPVPRRVRGGEILSRAVPIGAVEAPPGDELLILHRGRAVTAGYPVLGVVTSTSLDTLAQVRPGQQVRFQRTDVHSALSHKRGQDRKIQALVSRVRNAYTSLGIDVAALDRMQARPRSSDHPEPAKR
jgi:5-oxoprolinase (ATP-hydrolysing) subunit C